jgi:hypothetical protein
VRKVIAFRILATALANRIREEGSMDHGVNLSAFIRFMHGTTKWVVDNWKDVDDEGWMRLGASIAESWGYMAQNAISTGKHEDAKECINGLELLVEKLKSLDFSRLRPSYWAEWGICWHLAISLGSVANYASRAGLEEEARRAVDLLREIGEAAKQPEGLATLTAVVKAISIISRPPQRE